MNPEKAQPDSSEEASRRQDLTWIDETRTLLWLAATVAGEQVGRGVLVVDLDLTAEQTEPTIGYHSKGELDLMDERLHELLQEYNPHREFITILRKSDGQINTYLSNAPAPGWWEELHTHTRYPPADPVPASS